MDRGRSFSHLLKSENRIRYIFHTLAQYFLLALSGGYVFFTNYKKGQTGIELGSGPNFRKSLVQHKLKPHAFRTEQVLSELKVLAKSL